MIYSHILEAVFGSPARIRILRVLLSSPQPLSGRQVGEFAQLSHRGAIQALKSLVDLGAVRQRSVGNAYQYSLLRNHIAVRTIIEPCINAEIALLDDLKRHLAEKVGKDVVSLILYGSIIKGTAKKGSDLDAVAIVKDEKMKLVMEERVALFIPFFQDRYNAFLSLHYFTLHEVLTKKTTPRIRAIVKEGIVLVGKPLSELLT